MHWLDYLWISWHPISRLTLFITSNIRFFISSTKAQIWYQERPKDKRMKISTLAQERQKPKKIKDKNTHIGPPLNEDLGNLLPSTSNRIVKRGWIPEILKSLRGMIHPFSKESHRFKKVQFFWTLFKRGGGQTHVQKLCRKLSCVLEVI